MPGKTEKQLAVYAIIEEYNQENGTDYNPIVEMIKMGQDLTVGEAVRFNAHKTIAEYIYPKRRPEDQDGNPGNDYTIQIMNYTDNRVLSTINSPELTPGQPQSQVPKPILNENGTCEIVTLPIKDEE